METDSPKPVRLRDYTSAPLEVFVAAVTILPFFALAYFYDALPNRVPLFLNLGGEPVVWTLKSVPSVFRVPLMALDTQLICLLAKYGMLKSEAAGGDAEGVRRYLRLSARLWDWLRCAAAFKMGASSLDTVLLGMERFRFLSRPVYVFTAAAALLGAAGALYYAYRLLTLRREAGGESEGAKAREVPDARHVYGGVFYYNPADGSPFVRRYGFNFANVWAWALIVCLALYPLLVFLPS
ncbi:MAG TPA: hypothetical protein VFZ44_14700 [Pyrinomonadaceae bacterium]